MIEKAIILLNGPNLNMLGKRNVEKYGSLTLDNIISLVREEGAKLKCTITPRQSNHEGDLIEWIQLAADEKFDGIILNAGGYTHTSIALRDAVEIARDLGVPTMEVHLSDIHKRELFRHQSFLTEVCVGQVCGLKEQSYIEGLRKLAEHIERAKNPKLG